MSPGLGPHNLHRPLPYDSAGWPPWNRGSLTSWDPPFHCTFCKCQPRASPPAAAFQAPCGVRPSRALGAPAAGLSRFTEIRIARAHRDLKTWQ